MNVQVFLYVKVGMVNVGMNLLLFQSLCQSAARESYEWSNVFVERRINFLSDRMFLLNGGLIS